MPKKLFIRTFGCQMNEYDSAKMADILRDVATPAASADEADIIIFNTCSVRERAAEKVFSDIGRARPWKTADARRLIAVGGCVASQEGEEIIRRAPEVDIVFGPQTLHRLPEMIARREQTGLPQVDISFPEIEKFDAMPAPRMTGASAFVSVMEGCSKYCTFCVVPYTRGEEVSRPMDDVLTEIAGLAMNGAREITLLGQNVNAYRADYRGQTADFATLLECVAALPDILRVRFTTSHPVEFSERLINAFATVDKLPDYLHLPVQSGSDRVLAAMKRGYTALEYKSIIRKMRKTRPAIVISSDFIVGFPGESDDDFRKTMDLVDFVGFDFSYSFIFSPRPGTPAAFMADDTPLQKKKERLARLQEKLEANGKNISRDMVGGVQQVLVEGAAKKNAAELQGRCANNRMIHFAAPPQTVGTMAAVRVTATTPHALRGELRSDGDAGG